ncbi:MAG: hemolysin-type calcium-binding protein [Rhodobacterales bacterium]|nr:MAG: hemolysin-type calcium-binding protein [Rhodobacterales bacterium]
MRVDGPGEVLQLGVPAEEAQFRARVAQKAGRMLGLPLIARREDGEDDRFEGGRGFVLTDGYRAYRASVLDMSDGREFLLFAGRVPPRGVELWVVRADLARGNLRRDTQEATGVICFTPETRIRTEAGDKLARDIRAGDRVQTKDNGVQEVMWTGARRFSGARLYATPELRPIRLKAGALGVDRPDEDLVVSPNHRMLVQGARAQALFGSDEVLVSARDLVDDGRILRDHKLCEVTYVHLLLPRHEIVFANGLETESFQPTDAALAGVEAQGREEIYQLCPELRTAPALPFDAARRVVNRGEAALLLG